MALTACDALTAGLPHSGSQEDTQRPCFTPGDCARHSNCADIRGRFLDDAGACTVRAALGCSSRYDPCYYEVTSYAIDPSGQLWQFPNGCTPPGWRTVEMDAGLSDAWSQCTWADQDAGG